MFLLYNNSAQKSLSYNRINLHYLHIFIIYRIKNRLLLFKLNKTMMRNLHYLLFKSQKMR